MRTYMKGGVWKNSEDEVLKAAIMKYGLKSWSRVSSLLVNKSAKQCKARWYEWLDPNVKKTEWSREEEELLLQLAKMFPTQWRTIAIRLGRTAYQCQQHYERLLDQAQGRDENDQFDPRKIRPGEIDPSLECKPARADAVDMDDDEKEMLAEARARLANTRGKKAKRKAREKALEQTRRIACLQKRRELKSAGIGVGALKLHKSIMDYATEVPFEQQPPKGFYPPDEDKGPDTSIKSMQQLEGRRRDEEMNKLRKDDIRKLKRLQIDETPAAMAIFEKYEKSAVLKNRLVLPEPTMTDEEITQIVKMGADVQLLDNIARSTIARTPMTSSIMEEARMAAATNRLQTPLEGEMNVPDSGFTVPQVPAAFQTPNPIRRFMNQTPLSIFNDRSSAATPHYSDATSYGEVSDDDPIGERARMDMAKLYVKASISNLPEPESTVEISIPEMTEVPENIEGEREVDMEDLENKRELEAAKEREEALQLESSVIKEGLPRPLVYNTIVFVNDLSGTYADEDQVKAKELINNELVALIASDSVRHPMPGGKPCTEYTTLEPLTLALIKESASLIHEETELIKEKHVQEMDEEFLSKAPIKFSAIQKRYIHSETMSLSEQTTADELLCKEYRKHLENLSKRNKTLENKYTVSTGGYRNREQTILKEIGKYIPSIHIYLQGTSTNPLFRARTILIRSVRWKNGREHLLTNVFLGTWLSFSGRRLLMLNSRY
ncbi:conserved hypothetical protein [Theileria equi strain WA]|uniref:Uncharacterized protein n=1 Tax=Theileria equi strain WA TaxID=1537102 RepID=L1LGJ1_THEEQ|nr:conserved hypothetical protein [Theileria equi strain WA]EKX74370.1 conserved hypothetical protein [Theileria equi strain WA]|eukprot:XP_004833822.1 conserved hypothetical protein [Theileria equi strain WA]